MVFYKVGSNHSSKINTGIFTTDSLVVGMNKPLQNNTYDQTLKLILP